MFLFACNFLPKFCRRDFFFFAAHAASLCMSSKTVNTHACTTDGQNVHFSLPPLYKVHTNNSNTNGGAGQGARVAGP